jgi:GTP cyclohydrolase I
MACTNGKTDQILGNKIKERLQELGLETQVGIPSRGFAHKVLEQGIRSFLYNMGLDPDDPSTQATPERVADMYVNELCYGLDYSNFPKCTTTPNGSVTRTEEGLEVAGLGAVNEMVMVDSIQTFTLCEHHFQTISGVTHIAYIPSSKLLGLSKFARITNFFGRRPQVQERMTEQLYAALSFILETRDVAVQQVAVHDCMRVRGAMDPLSQTTTTKLGGRFFELPALRAEFLQAIPRRHA